MDRREHARFSRSRRQHRRVRENAGAHRSRLGHSAGHPPCPHRLDGLSFPASRRKGRNDRTMSSRSSAISSRSSWLRLSRKHVRSWSRMTSAPDSRSMWEGSSPQGRQCNGLRLRPGATTPTSRTDQHPGLPRSPLSWPRPRTSSPPSRTERTWTLFWLCVPGHTRLVHAVGPMLHRGRKGRVPIPLGPRPQDVETQARSSVVQVQRLLDLFDRPIEHLPYRRVPAGKEQAPPVQRGGHGVA